LCGLAFVVVWVVLAVGVFHVFMFLCVFHRCSTTAIGITTITTTTTTTTRPTTHPTITANHTLTSLCIHVLRCVPIAALLGRHNAVVFMFCRSCIVVRALAPTPRAWQLVLAHW
jgi:hypothetical protein